MDRNELTFARHHALSTKDWDTYQTIIRCCLRTASDTAALPATPGTVRSVMDKAIGLRILAILPQVGGLQ